MNKSPPTSGDCCLPSVDGVTFLKIGARQVTVGMQGLDKVFAGLRDKNSRPEEISDEELVSLARHFNYIPDTPEVEADYAAGLRGAYLVANNQMEGNK